MTPIDPQGYASLLARWRYLGAARMRERGRA